MIPTELLRVSVRGGALKPRFLDPDDADLLALADRIRGVFVAAAASGRTIGDVQEELDDEAAGETDPKLHRGLAKVAKDRCEVEGDPELDAPALRLEVFRRAAAAGPLAVPSEPGEEDLFGRPTARQVLSGLAAERGVSVEQLESWFYADLPGAKRVLSCAVPDAAWLLHRYNVGLVQGLLIGASRVELRLADPTVPRLRQLFRWVKFHQLLHRAEQVDGALRVVLDGPVSLFSASTRYGLQLARFFPALPLQDGDWSMKATVAWTRAKVSKELVIDAGSGLRSHYEDRGAWRPKAVEHLLARWAEGPQELVLEEAVRPLEAGRGELVFPDFSLRAPDGREVAVEVVGWWRHDTLHERLQRLQRHGPALLLLAVSKRLRAGPAGEAVESPHLLEYADVLPVRALVAAARRLLASPA